MVATQHCEGTQCPELCTLNRLISPSVNFTLIEKTQWSKDFSHIWPFSLRFSRSGLSSFNFFSANTSTQMQFIYCNVERISEGICNESGAETPSLQYCWLGPTAGIHRTEAAGPAGPSSKPGRGPRIPGGGREQPVWVTGSGAAGSLPTSRGPASSGQGRPRTDRGAPTASSARAALGLTFSRFSSHCPVLGWGRAGTAGSAGGGERGGQQGSPSRLPRLSRVSGSGAAPARFLQGRGHPGRRGREVTRRSGSIRLSETQ